MTYTLFSLLPHKQYHFHIIFIFIKLQNDYTLYSNDEHSPYPRLTQIPKFQILFWMSLTYSQNPPKSPKPNHINYISSPIPNAHWLLFKTNSLIQMTNHKNSKYLYDNNAFSQLPQNLSTTKSLSLIYHLNLTQQMIISTPKTNHSNHNDYLLFTLKP